MSFAEGKGEKTVNRGWKEVEMTFKKRPARIETHSKTVDDVTNAPSMGQYDNRSTAVVATICTVVVVLSTLLLGAAFIFYNQKRKRKWSELEREQMADEEKGKLLQGQYHQQQQRLSVDISTQIRRKSHEIDFTIPHGQFSQLNANRRVLSTPDLSQYDSGENVDDVPAAHTLVNANYGCQYHMPSLAKQYSIDYNNSFIRCSLGALDPELYKATDSDDDLDYPIGHLGRVWFTLEYQKELERLIVNIIKIKNLPSRVAGSVHGCDPVIKLCLLPDERRYMQSRQKRRTCHPRFDESFYFQISGKSIDERTLQITVFDVDNYKKFKTIGYVVYNLKDFDTTVEDKLFLTRDLSKTITQSPSSGNGEILVSLCYNDNIGRLTVTVVYVKGLPKIVDSYVKVTFLQHNKILKSRKTSIVKQSSDPNFNVMNTFKATSLETASVVVQLMQVSSGHGKDVSLGRVAFGSYMFAKGRALEHWNDMLSNCREQIRKWHYLQP